MTQNATLVDSRVHEHPIGVFRRALDFTSRWDSTTRRLGLTLLALVPILVLASAIDPRSVNGDSIWSKPIKFALAFVVYSLSLSWYSAYIQPSWRSRWRFTTPMAAGAVAMAMEQTIITLQSARGVGSHFNFASPLDSTLYALMGVGALVLTAMTLPVAIGLLRHAEPGRLNEGMCHALVAGLVLGFVLTMLTAGTMAALGGHGVGSTATSASAALPLMGWLRDAGDLRVPHFFGTHAMHAVPLMALALALWPWRRVNARAAWASGGVWTIVVGLLFVQALNGKPFIAL